jgi:hypothetical protein
VNKTVVVRDQLFDRLVALAAEQDLPVVLTMHDGRPLVGVLNLSDLGPDDYFWQPIDLATFRGLSETETKTLTPLVLVRTQASQQSVTTENPLKPHRPRSAKKAKRG